MVATYHRPMPGASRFPPSRNDQRLTVRLLDSPLDVERKGDVVTVHDSAVRHEGVSSGAAIWIALGFLAFAALVLVLLVLGGGASIQLWACGGAAVVFFVMVGMLFIVIARLPQTRSLRVDLQTGDAELRWADTELVRWVGDVDGLRLVVCPFRAKTPLGVGTMASGFASVAMLEGRPVPPRAIAAEHGPITATVLRLFASFGRSALVGSGCGWIVLATGEDASVLEAELREALPTLTRVIEPQRIDDVLAGPVDAKLLRKPKPRRDRGSP